MGKQVRRTFSACWTCRRRRVSCDAALPHCTPCKKRNVKCEGYHVQLAWVDPDTGQYPSHNRRKLNFEATWEGWPIYEDQQLSHFIEKHESGNCTCHTSATLPNPFGVIRPGTICEALYFSTLPQPRCALDTSPLSKTSTDERMLFHHYVNRVAFLMISVDGAENPWKSTYPVIALHKTSSANRSLYHALLAQSAFHISNLQLPKTSVSRRHRQKGLEHYVKSVKQLQTSFQSATADFDASIAALMTLTMIEGVYAAETQQWRCHMEGALSILAETLQSTPWLVSPNAWVLAQSLVLLFELAQTTRPCIDRRSKAIDNLREFVSTKPVFGYTVGASRDVLCCIAEIRTIRTEMEDGSHHANASKSVSSILERLCSEESDSDLPESLLEHHHRLNTTGAGSLVLKKSVHNLETLHRRIFRNATIIYLHRTIFNSTPLMIEEYVDNVLDDTITSLDLPGGTVSPWPVFMAAVEVYTTSARQKITRWLDFSCGLGIQNRFAAKQIIEDVWAEREDQAKSFEMNPNQIIVDWKQTQKRLGIDVLLL